MFLFEESMCINIQCVFKLVPCAHNHPIQHAPSNLRSFRKHTPNKLVRHVLGQVGEQVNLGDNLDRLQLGISDDSVGMCLEELVQQVQWSV